MKRTIERGRTLLVDGPACASLLTGKVEVLGASLRIGVRIVIRDGKRVPFEAKQKAEFDLILGEKALLEKLEGSTIPASWRKACDIIFSSDEKPIVVVVMGEVDSGKTSFSTYLANKALRKKHRVAIIDADLGQSDIGPPTTIGFCRLTSPISDPFLLEAEEAYFVGTTSPSGALNRVIGKLAKMKDESLKRAVDFLVINTDGWVLGEEAVRYKLRLAESVSPNVVFGLQRQDELKPILSALKEIKAVSIESPLAAKKRGMEKRKILRELSYEKYLKDAKMQSFPLYLVKVGDVSLGTGVAVSEGSLEKIRAKLGVSPLYCEESSNLTVIVLEKERRIDKKEIPNLGEELGRSVMLIEEGDEQGLLVGLNDEEEKLLGIGILNRTDYGRQIIQVYTPVTANVASIRIGQVKLDKQGKEIGVSPVFSKIATS